MGKILKIIGKNVLAFLGGAVLGIIAVIVFFLPKALERVDSLAVIALVPVFLIIYGIIGIIVGGLLGVVIYNTLKFIRRRKKS